MSMPLGKLSPIEWIATDAAQRDLIGSNDLLRVGNLCTLVSDGSRHICSSVDGGNASTWAAAAGGAAVGVGAQRQVQTTLAAISAKSIAAPLAFWPLNGSMVEQVTGGAGWDLVGEGPLMPNWMHADGSPGQADEVLALYCAGDSDPNVETDAENTALKLRDSMSVSMYAFVMESHGDLHTDFQNLVTYGSSTSTTIGTTTAPCYRIGLRANRGSGSGPGRQLYYSHFDDSGAPADQPVNAVVNSERLTVPLFRWCHIGFTRTDNGPADHDIQLYVDGRPFGAVGNIAFDPADPTSTNMRLIIGGGRNSISGYFGAIRDVGIWDSALSAANMLGLYEIGVGA